MFSAYSRLVFIVALLSRGYVGSFCCSFKWTYSLFPCSELEMKNCFPVCVFVSIQSRRFPYFLLALWKSFPAVDATHIGIGISSRASCGCCMNFIKIFLSWIKAGLKNRHAFYRKSRRVAPQCDEEFPTPTHLKTKQRRNIKDDKPGRECLASNMRTPFCYLECWRGLLQC